MNIHEFREQYPQYDSVSDDALARKLHTKFYADVPFDKFSSSFIPTTVEVEQFPATEKPAVTEIDWGIDQDRAFNFDQAGARAVAAHEADRVAIANRAGFVERFFKDPIKFMPVGGSIFRAARNQDLEAAKKRFEANNYSDEITWADIPVAPGGQPRGEQGPGFTPPFGGAYAVPLHAWYKGKWPIDQRERDIALIAEDEARKQEEARRGVSFFGKVGDIFGEMPAFVAEAGATSELSLGVRAGTSNVLSRLPGAGTRLGKLGVGLTSRVAGATARATVGTPGRIAQDFSERRLPQGMSFDDEGNVHFAWPDESPGISFVKAWGGATIEWFSEEFGDLELTPKVAQAVFKRLKGKKYAGKIIDKLYKGYQKIRPDATKLGFVKEAFALGGIHGIADEISEEYLGAAMRSVTGVSDQNLGEAMMEQMRETPAMAAAFSIFPGIKWSMASLAGKAFDPSQLEGEEHPEELLNWYEPTPRVMPQADVEDAVADTAVASEFHPEGLRKSKKITSEEQQVLDRLEEEEVKPEPVEGEEQGTVAPNLYIGNVTERAKKWWADKFEQARQEGESSPTGGMPAEEGGIAGEIKPEDIGPHTEKGWPTKRTGIEMSRVEAQETLTQTEEALDERLEAGEWTGPEIALMKAMWGDIRELRTSLGQKVGRMPFKVHRAAGQKIMVEIRNPTERIYAAIKGPSKKTLAQYDHKQLVTQGQAVKAKLKAVARVASRAYRLGSKEAVAKLRLHLRALKAKQRTLRMVRDYRAKLVEQITKPVSDNVDPLYVKAIRTMSGAMDTRERTGATQKRLAELDRALKAKSKRRAGKPIAGPEIAKAMKDQRKGHGLDLLKRLAQVPLENITTEQLQEIAAERLRLENEGKLENLVLQRKRSAAPMIRTLIDQLETKTDKLGEPASRHPRLIERTAKRYLRGASYLLLGEARMRRICEWLDNQERGSFTKFIYEPIKRQSLLSSVRRKQKVDAYYEFLGEQGVDAAYWMGHKDVFTLEDGRAEKLSKWEQIGVYIFAQEESARSHLTETSRQQELRRAFDAGEITEQQFYRQWYNQPQADVAKLKEQYEADRKLRENLKFSNADLDMIADGVAKDQQMKAVADYMTEVLDSQWQAIMQTSRQVGMDPTGLVKVSKYLPLLIRKLDYAEQDDLLQRVLGEFIPEDYLPERKFLKQRKKAKQDIELDAQMLFLHSVAEVEQFLAMAPLLSQLSHVLANSEFRSQLNRKTRGHGVAILSKYVVDSARGRVVREQDWIAKTMHKLNRHGIIYALGYNVPVILRQSISGLNALAMNPRMIPHFVSSVIQGTSPWEFNAMKEKVFSKSTSVRERSMEHVWMQPWNKKGMRRAALRASGHRIRGIELSRAATSFIRMVDMWTVLHSWNSAYEMMLERGASEEAAVRYADTVIEKTQPMARPEDLPHFFRGGVAAQWVNLFRNQINQNLNFWVHDIYGARAYGKITNAEVAYRVMMSYVLPAMVFGFVGRGFAPPKDEKQLATDLLAYGGGALLLAGRIVQQAIHGWGSGLGLSTMALEHPAKAIEKARQGDMTGVLKHAAATVAMWKTPGMPTAQMLRSAEGAMALEAGDTDDMRRLIWSEWALEQGGSEDKSKRKRRSVSGSGGSKKRRSVSGSGGSKKRRSVSR